MNAHPFCLLSGLTWAAPITVWKSVQGQGTERPAVSHADFVTSMAFVSTLDDLTLATSLPRCTPDVIARLWKAGNCWNVFEEISDVTHS